MWRETFFSSFSNSGLFCLMFCSWIQQLLFYFFWQHLFKPHKLLWTLFAAAQCSQKQKRRQTGKRTRGSDWCLCGKKATFHLWLTGTFFTQGWCAIYHLYCLCTDICVEEGRRSSLRIWGTWESTQSLWWWFILLTSEVVPLLTCYTAPCPGARWSL